MIPPKKVFRRILSMNRPASLLMASIPTMFHQVIANPAKMTLTKNPRMSRANKRTMNRQKKFLKKILVGTEEIGLEEGVLIKLSKSRKNRSKSLNKKIKIKKIKIMLKTKKVKMNLTRGEMMMKKRRRKKRFRNP